ncbi:MAG: hypothetical protein HY905_12260 [Deltaproteobacteria bacterium]|nr:hypothetical protein [Deltaproteobacteria bacterium]
MRTGSLLRMVLLSATLLLPLGCGDDGSGGDAGPDVVPDADAESDADGDASDAGDDGGDSDIPPLWRPCTTTVGAGAGLTLRGTVLTPDDAIPDGEVLLDTATGRIICVAEDCSTRPEASGGTLLCTAGVILPGLIDAHDHIAYGIQPRWNHGTRLYLSRYDWQGTPEYWSFGRPYDELQGSLQCQMDKYGEARMALGGATSVQGSAGAAACADPILRNLDMRGVNGFSGWTMEERVSRISGLSASNAADIVAGLADGSIDAFVPHIGEGLDEASRAEFDTLADLGLILPGTAVIHGTGAGTIELARLAAAGAGLIWSPRSNVDLYGLTTDIPVARNLGVRVALGPDWLPSGSASVLDELKCVDDLDAVYYDDAWTDRQLVEAVTSVAAEVLHIDAFVGRLQEGLLADVTVIHGDRLDPYRAVIAAAPQDVALVLRGGRLLAGDEDLAAPLATPFCEPVDACGTPKTICVKTTDSPTDGRNETLAELTARLRTALEAARLTDDDYDPADLSTTCQYDLAPLFACTPPPACRFGRGDITGTPTADDGDGDGADDAADDCPAVFNPAQSDFDGDGAGDACDPCPLDPGSLACPPPDPTDVDRDGVADVIDNCPRVQNPSQADADGDGTGDACERTALTIYDVQDAARPLHPAEGSTVFFEDVVVTAVFADGAFVQEPGGGPYGGILVYAGSAPAVAVGDRVDVSGTYEEYAGESEISSPVLTRRGAGTPAVPEVVLPADVATGGSLAESYEGVLVVVESVAVTDANPDAPADYNEFEVDGALRVDDAFYRILPDPVPGNTFSRLAGVLRFTHADFKLEPRGAGDVVP